MDWRGMDVELAEDLAALPGMNHVGRLLELESYVDSGEYEVIVLDAPPLAQFLDLPPALDASARWLVRLFAPRQANVFEPFLRVFAGEYASAGEDVLERGRALLGRLAALRDRFTDTEVTSVRLALTADADALALARHAATALTLFGCLVDALVLNRMLPDEVDDSFFAAAKARQAASVEGLRRAVDPLPVVVMDLKPEPAYGITALAELAQRAYGERDPLAILHRMPVRSFSRNGAGYQVSIPLPLAERDELDLEETEEGVAVHVEGRRCLLTLPDDARYYDRASWSLEEGVLKVVFER